MRKVFSLSLMLMLISSFSVCQAISGNRINAGGIYIGQSMSEVVSIYGKPISSSSRHIVAGHRHTETVYEYGRFGTTFNVIFDGNNVSFVLVAGNNGIATSDGIKVGTPVSEVKRILGPGHEWKGNGKHQISYEQNDPPKGYLPQSIIFYIENNKVKEYRLWNGAD